MGIPTCFDIPNGQTKSFQTNEQNAINIISTSSHESKTLEVWKKGIKYRKRDAVEHKVHSNSQLNEIIHSHESKNHSANVDLF